MQFEFCIPFRYLKSYTIAAGIIFYTVWVRFSLKRTHFFVDETNPIHSVGKFFMTQSHLMAFVELDSIATRNYRRCVFATHILLYSLIEIENKSVFLLCFPKFNFNAKRVAPCSTRWKHTIYGFEWDEAMKMKTEFEQTVSGVHKQIDIYIYYRIEQEGFCKYIIKIHWTMSVNNA